MQPITFYIAFFCGAVFFSNLDRAKGLYLLLKTKKKILLILFAKTKYYFILNFSEKIPATANFLFLQQSGTIDHQFKSQSQEGRRFPAQHHTS